MKTQILYIGLLLFSYASFAQQKNCAKNVSAKNFQLAIDSCDNELILDVRPNDIFKNKMIAGAVLIATKEELNSFTDTLDRDIPILVYCVIGVRSAKVCEILCEKEFSTVINLNKGIEQWKKKGFEVVAIEK